MYTSSGTSFDAVYAGYRCNTLKKKFILLGIKTCTR